MVMPDINYELKKKAQIFSSYPINGVKNLKFVKCRKSIFFFNIYSAAYFAFPWTLPPRTAAPLKPP